MVRYVRVTFVWTMQKSWCDALKRRENNRATCEELTNYLQGLPAYRRPGASPLAIYDHGVGSEGFCAVVHKETRQLVGLAGRAQATMDKMNFLSAAIHAVCVLSSQVNGLTLREAVAVCAVMLLVNNLEPFVNVILSGQVQREWRL